MGDTTRLPVTRFSTAQHLGPDRWDAWRDSISVLFDVLPLIAATAPDDEHSVLGAHLGAVLFGETRFAAQSFERSQRKLIGNGLDHYLVQFYAKGGYAGRTGDEDVVRTASTTDATASPRHCSAIPAHAISTAGISPRGRAILYFGGR